MIFLDDDPSKSAEDKMGHAMGCAEIGAVGVVVAVIAIVAAIIWALS